MLENSRLRNSNLGSGLKNSHTNNHQPKSRLETNSRSAERHLPPHDDKYASQRVSMSKKGWSNSRPNSSLEQQENNSSSIKVKKIKMDSSNSKSAKISIGRKRNNNDYISSQTNNYMDKRLKGPTNKAHGTFILND